MVVYEEERAARVGVPNVSHVDLGHESLHW